MRGNTGKPGRSRRGGGGRHCSQGMGIPGANQDCGYRRNEWIGPLRSTASFVATIFANLKRMLDREIEKARLKAGEQKRQNEHDALATEAREMVRLPGNSKNQLSDGNK